MRLLWLEPLPAILPRMQLLIRLFFLLPRLVFVKWQLPLLPLRLLLLSLLMQLLLPFLETPLPFWLHISLCVLRSLLHLGRVLLVREVQEEEEDQEEEQLATHVRAEGEGLVVSVLRQVERVLRHAQQAVP